MNEIPEQASALPRVRPLRDVIGLPSPETCRRLVVLLKLAEPRKERGSDVPAA